MMKLGTHNQLLAVCCLVMLVLSSLAWAEDDSSSQLSDRSRRQAPPSSTASKKNNVHRGVAHRRSVRHPGSRLILLILREKCQHWLENDVKPLPSYCYYLLPDAANTINQD